MAKKSSKKKGSSKPASGATKERTSDAVCRDELNRKASGNTLHAQQAAYYAHREKCRGGVGKDDVVVTDD